MSDIVIDKRARERILVLVTSLAWEEANVMSLLSHNNCEFDLVEVD